jgi:hypothetical protein
MAVVVVLKPALSRGQYQGDSSDDAVVLLIAVT